jgi:hypothetical protein
MFYMVIVMIIKCILGKGGCVIFLMIATGGGGFPD